VDAKIVSFPSKRNPVATRRGSGPWAQEGHDGGRSGAGRPKGSIERFTSGNLKHFRERYPIRPLDHHMMNVINAPPGTKCVTNARRDRMAIAAAPFTVTRSGRRFAKLKSIKLGRAASWLQNIDTGKLAVCFEKDPP
jgi:hypothetical protein